MPAFQTFLLQPPRLSYQLASVAGMAALCCGPAIAQTPLPEPGWQLCAATTDQNARLQCFDAWAQRQHASMPATAPASAPASAPSSASAPASTPTTAPASAPHPNSQNPLNAATASTAQASEASHASPVTVTDADTAPPAPLSPIASANGGCRDERYSEMSRFFELEPGTDCGTFNLRGYRPLSLSLVTANSVNRQPYSPTRGSAASKPYENHETRLQLSVRTKVASGLLTGPSSSGKDSLWFGYTQQSYWQLFNSELSRPFRSTDHEPELFYVYPTDFQLPAGWRWRYSGIGLTHQSNGQSNPLSRSWNRWYLMAGAELDKRWQLQVKAWQRLRENPLDDDNPHIQDYIGRGEIKLGWNINEKNHLGLTARGSLGKGKGSGRLEWYRTLGQGWNGNKSNLRLHVQLFSGYGDSLIDYNHKRTVLSVGLSLLDF